MEIQTAYKQKMSAQLKEWGAQLDLMEAKAENIGADINIKRAEKLHDLRAKQHTASEKMKELENSSGEAWQQVKLTADKIWDDLKVGIAEAHSKFN
jgi:hypothetical protein